MPTSLSSSRLTFGGRLPGVEATPAVPAPEDPLRLDVAAFVGFAQTGPLDLPVAVEDVNQFTAVFGGDLVLATDAGRPVYAQLPAAVRAFFDNGGLRCHVVRVAGPGARAARWAVPGLQVWQPDGTVADAAVEAAWPGAWSDGIQLGAQASIVPLATAGPYRRATASEAGRLPLAPGTGVPVQPGDLLRLELADPQPDDSQPGDGTPLPHLYVRVTASEQGTSALLTDLEIPYLPETGPAGADLPHPATLAGLPAQLQIRSAALLRLDLTVRQHRTDGSRLLEHRTDLAFNPSPAPDRPAPPAQTRRPVWTDVMQPAGDPTPDTGRSMVLRAEPATAQAALSGLVVPAGTGGSSTAAAPGDVDGSDDLGTFPVAAFVDPRLAAASVHSLVDDAARLTVLSDDPDRLTGVHALLDVEEVALVAMPDATQVGWSPAAPGEPPVAGEVAGYDESGLVGAQTALVTMCAARADLVALLSVPAHYDPPRVLAWQQRLTGSGSLAEASASTTSPLSYAGYWYPWLRVPEPVTPTLAPLRAIPPDGPVAGTIAARASARGAWVAPANIPLRGPVQTAADLRADEAARLFDAHANLLRQQPGSIVARSAHTLSAEPSLLQVSVRRLLIDLRKTALAQGRRYVFEVAGEQFRRRVAARFERILGQLAAAGALAAYQVATAAGDEGSVVVHLRVAPSNPIEFITVGLVRTGEGLLDVRES